MQMEWNFSEGNGTEFSEMEWNAFLYTEIKCYLGKLKQFGSGQPDLIQVLQQVPKVHINVMDHPVEDMRNCRLTSIKKSCQFNQAARVG